MAARTFAIGDIHGEVEHLSRVFPEFPTLDAADVLVLLGGYVNRCLAAKPAHSGRARRPRLRARDRQAAG